jgi:opacity protein-like surface antigen
MIANLSREETKVLRKAVLTLTLTVGSWAITATALAQDDPRGFYVGAGLGMSNLDQTFSDPFALHTFNGTDFGWKLFAGFRPIRWLGGEVEYIQFGSDRLGPVPSEGFLGATGTDRSAAAFAVGYLPLPKPWAELFAKIGWAQLWTHTDQAGDYQNVYVNGVEATHFYSSAEDNRNGLAYGGGIQVHFGALAARLEYERFNGNQTYGTTIDPYLLSVGLVWTL